MGRLRLPGAISGSRKLDTYELGDARRARCWRERGPWAWGDASGQSTSTICPENSLFQHATSVFRSAALRGSLERSNALTRLHCRSPWHPGCEAICWSLQQSPRCPRDVDPGNGDRQNASPATAQFLADCPFVARSGRGTNQCAAQSQCPTALHLADRAPSKGGVACPRGGLSNSGT
jgi:hypothetical protein